MKSELTKSRRGRSAAAILLGCCAALLAPVSGHAAPASRAAWMKSRRAEAQRALADLGSAQTSKPAAVWPAHRSRPALVTGLDLALAGRDAAERARGFVERFAGLFAGAGAGSPSGLELVEVRRTRDVEVALFRQTWRGIPVEGAQARVSLDRPSGRVRSYTSTVEPLFGGGIAPRPKLSPLEAARAAHRAASGKEATPGEEKLLGKLRPTLVVLADGPARLAYRVALPMTFDRAGRIDARVHYIDALTGAHLAERPALVLDGPPPWAAAKEVRP
jgi:hypothetical protein